MLPESIVLFPCVTEQDTKAYLLLSTQDQEAKCNGPASLLVAYVMETGCGLVSTRAHQTKVFLQLYAFRKPWTVAFSMKLIQAWMGHQGIG
jgi:hypothetical protein